MAERMQFMPIILASVTLISTGLGGMAALRFRDRLHLLLGFSSGAVIAVALFDILPEIFALDRGSSYMPLAGVGFLAFFALERYAALPRSREHLHAATAHEQELGALSAAGLTFHSFLDGVAIGAGFQTSTRIGLLIALGIIVHDLSDGLNTVTVVLAHGNPRKRAMFWLAADMIAPVLGAATALLMNLHGLLRWYLLSLRGRFFSSEPQISCQKPKSTIRRWSSWPRPWECSQFIWLPECSEDCDLVASYPCRSQAWAADWGDTW
jgi:ZIP family zinc transporter